MKLPDVSFETRVEWTGDFEGTVESPGKPPLRVRCPAVFCGGEGNDWSPEELFVAAIESCLLMTFLSMCARVGVTVTAYRSRARGVVRQVDNQYRFEEVTISVAIETPDASSAKRAARLLRGAERACLVSRSTNVNVVLESDIRAADSASAS